MGTAQSTSNTSKLDQHVWRGERRGEPNATESTSILPAMERAAEAKNKACNANPNPQQAFGIFNIRNYGIISLDDMITSYQHFMGASEHLFPADRPPLEMSKTAASTRNADFVLVSGKVAKESVESFYSYLYDTFSAEKSSPSDANHTFVLALEAMVEKSERMVAETEARGNKERADYYRAQLQQVKQQVQAAKQQFQQNGNEQENKEATTKINPHKVTTADFRKVLYLGEVFGDVELAGFTRVYTKGKENAEELIQDLRSKGSYGRPEDEADFYFAVSYKHYDDDSDGTTSNGGERVSDLVIQEILWTIDHLVPTGGTYRIWIDLKLPPSQDASVSGWLARGVLPYLRIPVLITSGATAFRPQSAWLRVEWLAAKTGAGVLEANEHSVRFHRVGSKSSSDEKKEFAALAVAPHEQFRRSTVLDEALIRLWAYSALGGDHEDGHQIVPTEGRDKFTITDPSHSVDWIRQAYLEGKGEYELETFDKDGKSWAGDLSLIPGHAFSMDHAVTVTKEKWLSTRWHLLRDTKTNELFLCRSTEFIRTIGDSIMVVAVELERPYHMVLNRVLHKSIKFFNKRQFRGRPIEVVASSDELDFSGKYLCQEDALPAFEVSCCS